jgi:hypothetical protein
MKEVLLLTEKKFDILIVQLQIIPTSMTLQILGPPPPTTIYFHC